jgi:hypothetical protein
MMKLVLKGALIEMRHLGVNFVVVDTDRILEVDFLAEGAHAGPTFACGVANWLLLSMDGGTIYTPVGTDVQTGIGLGAFTAGQRKAAKLKVHLPPGTWRRQARVPLYIGEGT